MQIVFNGEPRDDLRLVATFHNTSFHKLGKLPGGSDDEYFRFEGFTGDCIAVAGLWEGEPDALAYFGTTDGGASYCMVIWDGADGFSKFWDQFAKGGCSER